MEDVFRFREFKVYNDARIFYRNIVNVSSVFPRDCKFELISQLKRSSLSVILNIAEGSAKESDKDFKRYIGNSLGSINEVVACLEVAFDVSYISKELFDKLVFQARGITRQLGGFYKKLSKKQVKS